jgi:hypothetical protein
MASAPPTFLHIPKTAGSTMRRVMARRYPDLYRFHQRSYWEEELRPEAAHASAFCGHMPYGLHERLGRDLTYFTILRDPIPRVVSTYYYVQRRPDHPAHDTTRVPIEEYVGEQNVMTRMLAGVFNPVQASPVQDETLLDAAVDNCDAIAVVGLQHRFDETLALVAKRLDWGIPTYRSANRASGYPTPSPSTVRRLADLNALDVELYARMAARFERDARAARRRYVAVTINNRLHDTARAVRGIRPG